MKFTITAVLCLATIAKVQSSTTAAPPTTTAVTPAATSPIPVSQYNNAPSLSFCNSVIDQTQYPTWDVPPPAVASWTALVDWTKVPDIPVRPSVGYCPPNVPDTSCAWSCTGCVRPSDISQCDGPLKWGYSFDDGPTSAATSQLLPILAANGIHATFFCIGSRVVEFPATLCKSFGAGHQIGVHTWSHSPLTTQTNEVIVAEIKWTEKAIMEVTGAKPAFMRPPYGDIDDRVRAIMTQLGYKSTIWNEDTNDFDYGDPTLKPPFQLSWITGNFTEWSTQCKSMPNGVVSLDHDLRTEPVRTAAQNVPILLNAGWKVGPVADCNALNYYQDSVTTTTSGSNTTTNGTTSNGAVSNDGTNGANGTTTTTHSGGDASKKMASLAGVALAIVAGGISFLF